MNAQNAEGADPRFHVGQQVWLGNWRLVGRDSPRLVEVAKIGRKYATVAMHARDYKFDLLTGHAPDESGYYIETAEDRAAKVARAEATERLRSLGFRGTGDFPRGLSTEALTRIAEVVAADLDISNPPTQTTADSNDHTKDQP